MALRFYHNPKLSYRSRTHVMKLTNPVFSPSSSSRFNLASAICFASLNSLAVGNPEIFAFSSLSYLICLSFGDTCDKAVDGFR